MNAYLALESFVKVILGLLILLQLFHLLQERFGFILMLVIALYLIVIGGFELYKLFSSKAE